MVQGIRKLAAIMYTDMVGYTSVGQRNEPLALALLEEQRTLLRPILPKHNGREIKTIGDAFLIEFLSALDAVTCAYEIQKSVREFNSAVARDHRIHLRIGIHLGDVVESEGDISGDAVNVASRIESLAEDGGVCLSRQVYDHVYNKFEFPMRSLGPKALKNVISPIELFKVEMSPIEKEETPSDRFDRRRIAVLPFANISSSPADEYFSDGITDEIISTLSKISGLKVIARTSVIGYKTAQKKVSEIAGELQVGTVLEGSVRKAGDKLRISVQLIDTRTSDHLWSESYDRDLKDIFAIQSEIAKMVAEVLSVKLLSEEKEIIERGVVDPEAFALYLKGRFYWNERTAEGIEKALACFKRAVERDSKFALAYVGIADCHHVLIIHGHISASEGSRIVQKNLKKALELDEKLSEARATLGVLHDEAWRWEEAEKEFTRAIELNPSYATARHWYSNHLSFLGRLDEALRQIAKARELDPLSAQIETVEGLTLYWNREYDSAINIATSVLQKYPNFPTALQLLFWTKVIKHQLAEAEGMLPAFRKLFGENITAQLALTNQLAAVGKRKEALATLLEIQKSKDGHYVDPEIVAEVYIHLNDKNRALEWLGKGFDQKASGMLSLKVEPIYDSLRSETLFQEILERMGLS